VPYNSLVSRTDLAALVPEEVSTAMLNNLQAQSAVMALATRIPVSRNQTRFPVLSALPVAYFVSGDTGLKQTTEAAWDNKYMYVEEIATIVPIPEAVLDDSGFDVWGSIQPLMEAAIVRKFDAAVLFGTSAPDSWPDDIVTAAVAAGNVVARGAATAATGGLHEDLSDVVAALEADGYMANGAIGNVTLRARLRGVRDTAGNLLQPPPDIPDITYALPGLWPTGTSAAEAIFGDFDQLVVGVRQDMTYKLLTEAVITDASGNIVYNLAQQDMVAMRLVFRAAWQVSNPINFQEQTEANRYPFSVLRSPAS
jgi:HK97 family phage major capsid protein